MRWLLPAATPVLVPPMPTAAALPFYEPRLSTYGIIGTRPCAACDAAVCSFAAVAETDFASRHGGGCCTSGCSRLAHWQRGFIGAASATLHSHKCIQFRIFITGRAPVRLRERSLQPPLAAIKCSRTRKRVYETLTPTPIQKGAFGPPLAAASNWVCSSESLMPQGGEALDTRESSIAP